MLVGSDGIENLRGLPSGVCRKRSSYEDWRHRTNSWECDFNRWYIVSLPPYPCRARDLLQVCSLPTQEYPELPVSPDRYAWPYHTSLQVLAAPIDLAVFPCRLANVLDTASVIEATDYFITHTDGRSPTPEGVTRLW